MQALWQEIFRRERERERQREKKERENREKKKERLMAVEYIFRSVFQNALFFPIQ